MCAHLLRFFIIANNNPLKLATGEIRDHFLIKYF
jgi:hypothetical protein